MQKLGETQEMQAEQQAPELSSKVQARSKSRKVVGPRMGSHSRWLARPPTKAQMTMMTTYHYEYAGEDDGK
ncbi:hypothetical protein E2P81_ATG00869 [Venturia nashicola]|nr:hypothetical protein E2P81_ATG00869 [Venturia nashicola]